MRRVSFTIGVMVSGFAGTCWAVGPCAATPSAAVKSFESGQTAEGGDGEGYRVTRVRRDAVLGTRWAMVERCGHPEWPGVMLRTASPAGAGEDDAPKIAGATAEQHGPRVVRAGETVRLWRHDANVRLEMAAVSEEGGATGERIRMRVIAHQEYGESVRYVYGLVRGPADVEME